MKSLAIVKSEDAPNNYSELVDLYNKSSHGSKPVRLFLKDQTPSDSSNQYYYGERVWYSESEEGVFIEYHSSTTYSEPRRIIYIQSTQKISIQNDKLLRTRSHGVAYPPGDRNQIVNYYGRSSESSIPWVEPTNKSLWVALESGAEIEYTPYSFGKDDHGY